MDDGYYDSIDITRSSFPEIRVLGRKLTKGSIRTYHERNQDESKSIDYLRDPVFGGFAKAWLAWMWLDEELLSESGFVSLAHTLSPDQRRRTLPVPSLLRNAARRSGSGDLG
jgi:hypothetical protein